MAWTGPFIGVYGYPIEAATRIAVETVSKYLSQHDNEPDVTFCCFSARDLAVYRQMLAEHGPMEERDETQSVPSENGEQNCPPAIEWQSCIPFERN